MWEIQPPIDSQSEPWAEKACRCLVASTEGLPREHGMHSNHQASRLDLIDSFRHQVQCWIGDDPFPSARIWKLIDIPEKVGGAGAPSQFPYLVDPAGQYPSRTQRSECEHDDFGTMVTEVTTITTRKRQCRVEGV
jgi:hypothetical protein